MSAAGSCQAPHAASSTYVVMPTTGIESLLATLEHPLALVVGHDGVEQLLLGARVVHVMVDHLVAEQRARDPPAFEPIDRLAHRMREPLDVGLVRVALERGPELELLLDSVAPGGEQRREREVRIRVGSGDSCLGT